MLRQQYQAILLVLLGLLASVHWWLRHNLWFMQQDTEDGA
jgi:hypothetical protein